MDDRLESIILISDKSQLKKALKLYDKFSAMGKRSLIFAPDEIEFKNNDYAIRRLSYYQGILKIQYVQIRQEASDLFHSLSDIKVVNDISLRELTTYKNVSLWDLSAYFVCVKLIPLFYYINIAAAALEIENPREVFAINNNGDIKNAFCLVCRKKQVNFTTLSADSSIVIKTEDVINKCLDTIRRIKRFFNSLYFLFINLIKSWHLKEKYKVIFFVPTERFFLSMLPVVLRYSKDDRLVINSFYFLSTKKIRENKISYLDFFGFEIYKVFSLKMNNLLKRIKSAISGHSFFDSALYKGFPIGGLLTGLIGETIREHFPEKVREIDIMTKIILTYKPKVVVTVDCCHHLALIAKSLSVFTVVHSWHPEDFILLGSVAVDVVTVEGNFWKDYLLQHNVNSNKVTVVGSLRFEYIKNINRMSPRLSCNTDMMDMPGKKVVFATVCSSLAQGTIRYQNLEKLKSVCNAMKNIKDVHLIIKLHPYETAFTIYKNIVRRVGLINYSIIRDVESVQLIYYCDLIITHISAVSYEAVLMDKNVILLCSNYDFRGDDSWDFERYGAVIMVDKLAELETQIRKALFGQEMISMLKRNREEYVKEHAGRLDKDASVKVKEVIDKFCSN